MDGFFSASVRRIGRATAAGEGVWAVCTVYGVVGFMRGSLYYRPEQEALALALALVSNEAMAS